MTVGEYEPAWSPDGQWLAYATWDNAQGGFLYRARADGTGQPQRLTMASAFWQEPVYSNDGARLVDFLGRSHEGCLVSELAERRLDRRDIRHSGIDDRNRLHFKG